ncbi:hypothetical protein F7Q99_36275 [Streptomyces kaniharaensis]|uniref:Uncharacterized protein n=1 Tax=Streptomyces kaniharaensis TaxID=212423 RepID=A0A6N7L179_9ACTN|nr:hypothetical protein [Streptomyces kaniharaensis]MQS17500.1 hypothetical protein [Streptomyces kaniharaensis]
MHDPELPDHPPTGAGPDWSDSTGDDSALGRVAEKIEQAAAWYTEQIHAERRRPAPDPDRVEQLLAERAACTTALRDLPEATAQELERIEALYDARLNEITGA